MTPTDQLIRAARADERAKTIEECVPKIANQLRGCLYDYDQIEHALRRYVFDVPCSCDDCRALASTHLHALGVNDTDE